MARRLLLFGSFVILMLVTLKYGGWLKEHGPPLVMHPACHGIGSLELTAFPSDAKAIVKTWDQAGQKQRALDDIKYDYGFIVLYVLTLGAGALCGRFVLTDWLASIGGKLAIAMLIAGFCDVIENIGMTQELGGAYGWAPVVCTVSAIKWVISLGGVLYALCVLISLPWRWRSLLGHDGVKREDGGS